MLIIASVLNSQIALDGHGRLKKVNMTRFVMKEMKLLNNQKM